LLPGRGRELAATAGRALAALDITFEAVYTSPKVRARDTALLACEALHEEPIVTPVLADDFTVADARDLLLGVEPDGRVLVVGHNPDFAQVVFDLTGARVDFKKGGVACVRLEGSANELLALLRPRELAAIV
jgi:phosphohistidine phosphatase